MHETTRGEDLLQKLLQARDKLNLPFDKLCGVVTDDTPAMVEIHKGMVSLLKKKIDASGIRPERLVSFHCTVRSESHCAPFIVWCTCRCTVTF